MCVRLRHLGSRAWPSQTNNRQRSVLPKGDPDFLFIELGRKTKISSLSRLILIDIRGRPGARVHSESRGVLKNGLRGPKHVSFAILVPPNARAICAFV